jgi:hypothetical protein
MWTGTDWIFTAVYGVGFAILVGTEVVGIRRKAPNDTITENWRKLDKNLHGPQQWGYRVGTAGFLVWILLHLMSVSGGWA